MAEHYVFVDCDRIQDYVFASPRLREICNASQLLDWIERENLQSLATDLGGTTIRSGGGVFLAKFEALQRAQQFMREAPHVYRQYGSSAVAVEHTINTPPKDFHEEVLLHLQRKLRHKKDCPEGWGLHISTLLAVPCESSGIGPAQQPVDLPDRTVRAKGSEAKKRLFKRQDSAQERLEERLQWEFGLKLPYDFGGLVDWTQREQAGKHDVPGTSEERVLGIIYADVNSLGRLLPVVGRDAGLYAAFSKSLRQTLEESLCHALQIVLGDPIAAWRKVLGHLPEAMPIRVLYIGGDDLAVAIQGRYALDLATNLLESFKVQSAELLKPFSESPERPPHLTLSAGMVLAPCDYPIQQFNRLGRGLEARAKRFGRQSNPASPPSQVELCIVKNDAGGDLSQLRQSQKLESQQSDREGYGGSPETRELRLFGGPYTPDELQSIKQGIIALQDFPRRKWKALREVFCLSIENAQFRYAEWWSGLKPHEQQLYKKHVCQVLGLCTPPLLPIWMRGYNATPVIDMIELSDLMWSTVGGEGKHAQDH